MFTVAPSMSARPASRAVCANANAANLSSRRKVLGLSLVMAPLFAGAAMALIPDDDDEEMVERAKANRKKKLLEDKEVQRRFVDTSDSRNRSVEQNIPPVQTAVYKLAKAGSELEQGNPKAAAETLSASASWVAAFTAAGRKLATTPETTDKLDVIVSGIQRAAAAADGGDLAAAKVGYVAAVEAVESWVVDLGIASQIKGL